jgi:hypothetical protein
VSFREKPSLARNVGERLFRPPSGHFCRLALFLYLGVSGLAAPASAQFETRGTFTTLSTSTTISLATGDFNRDGIPDLAVVSYCCPGGGVSILLGNGDGTFQPAVNYAAGDQPWSVVAVDLNRDGKLDLVVANSLGRRLTVLLGNGDGSFRHGPQSPALAAFQNSVFSGDFNGDGKPDIAALSYQNPCKCISILLGNGDGTFQEPIVTAPPFEVDSIGIGDFNGDGKLDIATAGDYTVNILLGQGNGRFEYGASYPSPETPESITVADFNGDHKLDFATANSEGGSISVLLGNGDGTFQNPVNYTIPFCSWVTTADVNGDGKPDLVAATDYEFENNISGIAVFLGNGDGSFQDPVYYSGPAPDTSYVVTADFNRDGKVDAAITNFHTDEIVILLNTGVVVFSPTTPLVFKKQSAGTTSQPQMVTLTNTGKTELKISSMKTTGQFGMSSTCGSAVAAEESCTISVTFSPKSKGLKSGTVTINDNASSKPQVIELSGTGS